MITPATTAMKHLLCAACTALALLPVGCSGLPAESTAPDYAAWVDPFIGTGGHGHVFLGANVPFGMVQLGPSQRVKGWDWCSGYHYSDSVLVGFSHTHLSGTGIGDLGDITLLPATGRRDTEASFSHANEECSPGYYRVRFNGSDIIAELTATCRTGLHRYTFPDSGVDTAFVKLDLAYGIGWDAPVETHMVVDNDSTVSGWRHSSGWAEDQRIFFTARFSRPMISVDTDTLGRGLAAMLAFEPDGPLEVRVGISPVSVANAKLNLEEECGSLSFDRAAVMARDRWNRSLSKIHVKGGSAADRRKFYTALYHTMFAPVVFCDVNGDYRGADGGVYSTNGDFVNYSVFSLWDTYRAAHPLSTLIHPEMQRDYARTFTDIFDKQGKLPVWHLHGNETDCMIGNPGVIVLADLLLKGFVEDSVAAYEAMKSSCLLDERSMDALKAYGYVPYDAQDGTESVAKGLEYAVADDAVAKVARALGRTEDAAYFAARALSYRRYFDPATGFMRTRSSAGSLREGDFDPFATVHRSDDYCEGNAWQYAWLVPHDPDGLIGLFGSTDAFVSKLDSLFIAEGSLGDGASPDISGLIGQYAHGNEPGHHTLYLYSYAGCPWKAAPLLRRVMNDLYRDEPDGLCGNEDVGQMSAWYVLSAMGLYQVEPAGGKFVFGSPVFDSVRIDNGSGRPFEIIAGGNSDKNIYVGGVWLNGKPYEKTSVDFSDIRGVACSGLRCRPRLACATDGSRWVV